MKEFQFVTDGYRLFSAFHRLCDGQDSWFNCGASQKFVLRQLKAMDVAALQRGVDESRKRGTRENHQHRLSDDCDMDQALLMLYGYILYLGRSFSLALSMFFSQSVNVAVLTYFRLFLPGICLRSRPPDHQPFLGPGIYTACDQASIRRPPSPGYPRLDVSFPIPWPEEKVTLGVGTTRSRLQRGQDVPHAWTDPLGNPVLSALHTWKLKGRNERSPEM